MKNSKKFTDDEIIEALKNGIKFAEQEKVNDPETKKFLEDSTKSAKDTLEKIRIIQNHNFRISKLIKIGFKEESIILTVTIFEVLMKDYFWKSRENWFWIPSHNFFALSDDEKLIIRNKISNYLEGRKLRVKYKKNLCQYPESQNSEIDCLYEILNKNDRKINFQNLDIVKDTFLTFFDIDISKSMDSDEEISLKNWDLLNKIIEERHLIIHEGRQSSLTEDQILVVLKAIDTITHNIVKRNFVYVRLNTNRAISVLEEKLGIKLKHI